jgi:hypothetical protein
MAASCTGFIEPLNLECSLINMFAGTIDLFLFISFIALAAVMAKFKMRNETALLLFAIYAILFSVYMPGLYVLVILLGGIIIFFSLRSPL